MKAPTVFTVLAGDTLHPQMKKIMMALVAASTLLTGAVSAKTEKQMRDEQKAKDYKAKKAAEKAQREAKKAAKKK